jgi:hypothetical protein
MEWTTTWEDPLMSYVKQFDGLIADKRTGKTLRETVKGIITAGSLIGPPIAVQSGGVEQVQLLAKLVGWQPHKDYQANARSCAAWVASSRYWPPNTRDFHPRSLLC